uniref:Adenylate cyclase type 8 n=1 Tax=Sphaerodactylus townsendi TaxID=933632 RepID=A0ACB8FEA2_9SAUR
MLLTQAPHPNLRALTFWFSFSSPLQLEYTARLDFLWRGQAKEEINEMKELREHNENMLRNILPSHVARHFLEKDRDNEDLYSQSYDAVGVMFASIPGFADFYSQIWKQPMSRSAQVPRSAERNHCRL